MYEPLTGGHNPQFIEEDMGDTEFQLYQRLELIEQRIKKANDGFIVQSNDGNWNANQYMVGMYNGMEYILSIIEGREPNYREFSAFSADEPSHSDVEGIAVDDTFVNKRGGYLGRNDNNDGGEFDGESSDDDLDIDGGDIDVDPAYLNKD